MAACSSRALPRSGGGISQMFSVLVGPVDSSPLRRGYFLAGAQNGGSSDLFPAQAGVFLINRAISTEFAALPRSGGGISIDALSNKFWRHSSPLRRGYFLGVLRADLADLLFPAQAGVFPICSGQNHLPITLPRSGGGISLLPRVPAFFCASSPLRRGYFP